MRRRLGSIPGWAVVAIGLVLLSPAADSAPGGPVADLERRLSELHQSRRNEVEVWDAEQAAAYLAVAADAKALEAKFPEQRTTFLFLAWRAWSGAGAWGRLVADLKRERAAGASPDEIAPGFRELEGALWGVQGLPWHRVPFERVESLARRFVRIEGDEEWNGALAAQLARLAISRDRRDRAEALSPKGPGAALAARDRHLWEPLWR